MEKLSSIYSKQNPKIRNVLTSASSLEKVMGVALDFSKASHEVLFFNGHGDVLKKPFSIPNSPEGVTKLLAEVKATCAHRKIRKQHVFFGGEDSPTYVENFARELTIQKLLVVRVNAWATKKLRDNNQASTDKLDVYTIAKALLNNPSYCDQDRPKIYDAIRESSRNRHYFVEQLTEVKLHIHQYVERLFPGFLNEKKSAIAPFSKASLALMKGSFSSQNFKKRQHSSLVSLLQKAAHPEPELAAKKLRELANSVLPADPEMISCWQLSLNQIVKQFETLEESIALLNQELAAALAKTPAALFTSISGLGVVLASGLVAEIGPPSAWRGLRSTCSYVGIVPGVDQTGGPGKPAITKRVKRRCNRRAKNWVVWAGAKMGECGPEELKQMHARLKNNGQHADFIMAKRLLRICKNLVRRETIYRPKALLEENADRTALIAYYMKIWDHLIEKWRGLVPWEELFDPKNPLGAWRQMVQSLYGLSLPFPKKRSSK